MPITFETMQPGDSIPIQAPPEKGCIGVARVPWNKRVTIAMVADKFPSAVDSFVVSTCAYHNAMERSYMEDCNATVIIVPGTRDNVMHTAREAQYCVQSSNGADDYITSRSRCTCKAYEKFNPTPCKHMCKILRFEEVVDNVGRFPWMQC